MKPVFNFQLITKPDFVFQNLYHAFTCYPAYLNNCTGGVIEAQFNISGAGSMVLNRITSTNAYLYSYFIQKMNEIRLNSAERDSQKLYSIKLSIIRKPDIDA